MSIKQLGGITMLDFDGMAAQPSVKDAQQLGRCLNLCANLKKLDLSRVGMSDEACCGLFSMLAIGALPLCKQLWLQHNQIGDVGLKAFADACGRGALAQLRVSSLPTALASCLEPWHARFPGLTVSFDVPYVPYAGS